MKTVHTDCQCLWCIYHWVWLLFYCSHFVEDSDFVAKASGSEDDLE